jgi:hypothetical protein
MSQTSSPGPQWSGDMLNRPELVAAFSAQLRRQLAGYAEFVAAIRRDAEAMWAANPPEGYGSFEAWWRHRWVRGPLRDIQEHLEEAAALTHALEARYRRGRHEIPAARQAAAAKNRPALTAPSSFGAASRQAPSRPSGRSGAGSDQGGDFMGLVRGERGERSA